MPVMVKRKKWILYRPTCDFELLKAVALDVKNTCKTDISPEERVRMNERLTALDLYKTRNPKHKPLDSINHRINTLEFWMFGYEQKVNKQKKFMFSPLGNLFLRHIENTEKTKKIFLAMLFAMQFQHPGSSTDKSFELYPFRLILKLLLDNRLERKIYNYEYAYLIAFLQQIDHSSYEALVKEMLKMRKMELQEIEVLFKKDEHAYVNTVYEWAYYTKKLLDKIEIFNYENGERICGLYHPTKTNSKSKPTPRYVTTGHITLNDNLFKFTQKLLNTYPYDEKPLRLDDAERLTADVIKEIYSFYPQILLEEIGENNQINNSKLLELPKLIERYSNNPENDTAYLFEDVLVDGFNMFYNVEAKRIGGAGQTDIECLYLTKKKKFAVESKSTTHKLLSINDGRLRQHRKKISGEYTIVITPRYVPAAQNDILGTPNVIILANTFAEYLYNHIINDIRNIDYEDFDSVIVENLGQDISEIISNRTIEKFAACG